jgi:transketolase
VGEQQLDQVASDELVCVPVTEFRRVLEARLPARAKTELFAAMARINVLYMIARAWSGHIGTSFSSLDVMSWLFLNEIRDLDKGPAACDIFFSSKGHDAPALYAVLIGLGLLPEEKLDNLRRLDGLPGHPHVETPFVQANTGSLGMGISKAKGMALANRLKGSPRRIFVLTGDGELQEGQFWESLASAAHAGLSEIVAIIDHNKIQSDTWVKDVSDLGDLAVKLRAFGWHVARCDGHDVAALETTLRSLDAVADRPKAVIADTIKGKGVSFMEGPALGKGELYAYHSGAPTEDEYARGSTELLSRAARLFEDAGLGSLVTAVGRRPARREPRVTDNLIGAYRDALVEQADRHPHLVVLDADLVKDCGLVPFAAKYPARFVECGIAEQDMVSMACGIARRGLLPVAHSFACFLAARPNEQIYNQCSEGSKVIYVGSLAGLLPGGPGHSHQSVRDIAALGAIPGLLMAEPALEAEVRALFDYFVNTAIESAYLRLVSVKWPMPFDYPAELAIRKGRGWVVREGRDVVVFGYGPWLLANAWHAAQEVERSRGISVRVINLPWLNYVDSEWLRDVIGATRAVVTLDNHYVRGGQGQMIAAAIAGLGLEAAVTVSTIGVTELPECGTNDEILAHHGLDVSSLSDVIRTAAENRPRSIASQIA